MGEGKGGARVVTPFRSPLTIQIALTFTPLKLFDERCFYNDPFTLPLPSHFKHLPPSNLSPTLPKPPLPDKNFDRTQVDTSP